MHSVVDLGSGCCALGVYFQVLCLLALVGVQGQLINLLQILLVWVQSPTVASHEIARRQHLVHVIIGAL